MDRRDALTFIGVSAAGGMLAACTGAQEEEAPEPQQEMVPEPSADDGLVELLFVQESEGMRFADNKLTLVKPKPRTLYFADRPDRVAGFMSYQEYVDMVYQGPDNFEEDPPNATLMIDEGDDLIPIVIEVSTKPVIEGEDMVFASVKIIEGEMPAEGGTSVLFIDTIGRPLSPVSVAGVHRRTRRRVVRRVT